jgi:hypothetical protein
MSNQVCAVNVALGGGTVAVGTTYAPAFKVPTDANGGGITILAAGVASQFAIAAGSAPVFELVYLGSTSAIAGTLGTCAAGAFTAGTVKELTITTAFIDAPYYVAFKVGGTAVNGDQLCANGYITYVMGR